MTSTASKRSNEAVGLFFQWRVAAQAILMVVRGVGGGIDQLPQDTRPHRPAVEALSPIVELCGVAGATGAGIERGLERAELGGRCALRTQGPGPVVLQKALDLIHFLSFVGTFGSLGPLTATGQDEYQQAEKWEQIPHAAFSSPTSGGSHRCGRRVM